MTLDPIQKRQYGILAIMIAVAFLVISGFIQAGNAIRRDSVVKSLEANTQQCAANLTALGATKVNQTGNVVEGTWDGLNGGMAQLGNSSAAAMSCPGWTMTHFCMGHECGNGGAMITLKHGDS